MAQNVVIAGATYNDVPSVNLITSDGSTANFVDTSDANATAPDILQGKTAYVDGEKIVGTGSGGESSKYKLYLEAVKQWGNEDFLIYFTNRQIITNTSCEVFHGEHKYFPPSGEVFRQYAYADVTPSNIGEKIYDNLIYKQKTFTKSQDAIGFFGNLFVFKNTTDRITKDNFLTIARTAGFSATQTYPGWFLIKYPKNVGYVSVSGDSATVSHKLCVYDAQGTIIDVDTILNVGDKLDQQLYSLDNGLAVCQAWDFDESESGSSQIFINMLG